MRARNLQAASNVPEGMRMCGRCLETKPLEDFKIEDGRRRYVYDAANSKTCASCRVYGSQKAAEARAKWSPERKKKSAADKVEYHKAQRAKMLEAYGGTCKCCGETTPEFLAIDHVHSDGYKHRKEIGYDTAAMYRWAKKHGFPPSLQLLCHNCNVSKAFYGGCPHEKFSVLRMAVTA